MSQGLITEGLKKRYFLLLANALGMIASSIYLTKHYFDTYFPSGLSGAASLCDISAFLNCNATTLSPASNIMGIPISIFGIAMGLVLGFAALFPSKEHEKTLYPLVILNAVGCLGLFIYSLAFLGHLCPFCTFYYLLSWAVLGLFLKFANKGPIDPKSLAIYAAITTALTGIFFFTVNEKKENLAKLAPSLIKQFDSNKKLGAPNPGSGLFINKTKLEFTKAPIWMAVFSDFQCPACKMLNDLMPKIKAKYKDFINIQYFFYPLDSECNSEVNRRIHPLACKGAYLAYCAKDNFLKVHDDIFNNQSSLSDALLNKMAKKENVVDCYNDQKTKKSVAKITSIGSDYGIKSTPTILVNGVKIEGVLPIDQLFIIFDELIRRHQK